MTLKHFDANSLEGGAEADQGYDRHDFSATISKYLLADGGGHGDTARRLSTARLVTESAVVGAW